MILRLRYSSHSCYAALANDHAMRSEIMPFPRRKQKERGPNHTSKPTHKARSIEEVREEASVGRLSTACSAMCVKIICDSSGRFPLPRRAGRCVSESSFTNEPRISAIEAPVWNDGCMNLFVILSSDHSCGLRNCRYLLLMW